MNAKQLQQTAQQLRNQGKGLEAVEQYTKATEQYVQSGQLAEAANCQHMVGVSYKIENKLDEALAAYQKAMTLYEQAGDLLGPGRVLRDMGISYIYAEQLDKAEALLLQSQAALETIPATAAAQQPAELGITMVKLGVVHLAMGRFPAAEEHMMSGLLLIRQIPQPFYELTALMHLGSLFFATKYYGRMLANLQGALGILYEYQLQTEHTRRLCEIWGLLAHGYIHHGNHQTATYFASKAFAQLKTMATDARAPIAQLIQAETLRKKLDLT